MKKSALLAALAIAFSLAALSHAQIPPPAIPPPALPLPPGPVGPIFTVEYNTDLPGGDLRPGFPVSDIGQCMDTCASDPGCRSFTFVKPHEQPPRRDNVGPLCWIKGSVPNKMMNPGMLSGIKR